MELFVTNQIEETIQTEFKIKYEQTITQLNKLSMYIQQIPNNKFVVANIDLQSLKFFDHLKNIDDNTTLIIKNCYDVRFEEVPSRIRNLIFEDTRFSSLEGIHNMRFLKNLQIIRLVIKDCKQLNLLESLTNLTLNNNSILDTEFNLSNLNKLTVLDLSNNFTYGQNIILPSNVKMLNLGSNKISNLGSSLVKICQMRSLVKLDLSNNQIQDISPIYNNESLIELDLSYNDIQSMSEYEHTKHGQRILQNLKVLVLKNNNIYNISDLRYMTNLKYLDISKNKLEDVQPLQHLSQIKCLVLGNNIVYNLWPLKHLVNLEELHVNFNQIIDISVVRFLINLKHFNFQQNFVKDISVLVCMKLDSLMLRENYIDDEQHLGQLRESGFDQRQHQGSERRYNALLRYQSKKIIKIFGTNNTNQNINEKIKQTTLKIKQFTQNVQEILQRTVVNQIHFTGQVINLFNSIQE
ncbi:leucine-rich_repeat domain-containing protein [Hexamita inflata]|uniref:Leucine-rich repeat domain-containing protein n=1 Tax=Hexamita inflata TaxID=28002 RepID=A0AA86PU92_9EUKA|nr:leucine-rich repeat domain-containing protein [Hexamita inflata]